MSRRHLANGSVHQRPECCGAKFAAESCTHDAIAEAQVGAPVRLSCVGDCWQIENFQGLALGRMSKAFVPLIGTKFVTREIAAIIHWRREDADERFHHLLKRANWQVVVPELVFEEVKEAERVFRKAATASRAVKRSFVALALKDRSRPKACPHGRRTGRGLLAGFRD